MCLAYISLLLFSVQGHHCAVARTTLPLPHPTLASVPITYVIRQAGELKCASELPKVSYSQNLHLPLWVSLMESMAHTSHQEKILEGTHMYLLLPAHIRTGGFYFCCWYPGFPCFVSLCFLKQGLR